MARGRGARGGLVAAVVAVAALGPAAALAAKGNVKFGGDTAEGGNAKIVVDSEGRAVRGAWVVVTDCDGQYEDFQLQISMRKPLDRSTQDGFRDVASTTDSDGTYSARYKHEVEGEYDGKKVIEGNLKTTVVFRRNGNKYVTCTDDVDFTVNLLKSSKDD